VLIQGEWFSKMDYDNFPFNCVQILALFLSLLSMISIMESTYVYVGLVALYYRHFHVALSR
jgi:hypothetical protein